jgi:hypothetical protein
MLGDRGFAVERLGIGDWPDVSQGGGVIGPSDWLALVDQDSSIVGEVALAYDVSPMRTSASIAAAGKRADGLLHVDLIWNKQGTSWVIPELKRLVERHQPGKILCHGPARALTAALESEGITVEELADTEFAQACAQLVDTVNEKQVRHLGSPELASAIRGADTSPMGDAWRWSRKRSTADITPLVAATEALWGAAQLEEGYESYDPTQYWNQGS